MSVNQQINEINYEDDSNILAKKRNDEELEKCFNTCKMYLTVSIILLTIVICITLIVIIIFNIQMK
tara:strand:- start:4459 stop:4656 length:198 start_codon:yes stop_codon:yes gene_type:complete